MGANAKQEHHDSVKTRISSNTLSCSTVMGSPPERQSITFAAAFAARNVTAGLEAMSSPVARPMAMYQSPPPIFGTVCTLAVPISRWNASAFCHCARVGSLRADAAQHAELSFSTCCSMNLSTGPTAPTTFPPSLRVCLTQDSAPLLVVMANCLSSCE